MPFGITCCNHQGWKKQLYNFFYIGPLDNSYQGIGFLIDSNLSAKIAITNQPIATASIDLNDDTTVDLINANSPTPGKCDKHPEARDDFYEALEETV